MGRLTGAQQRDYNEQIPNLEALVRLASANFPRPTDIRLETVSADPHASLCVSPSMLGFLIAAGRAALAEKEG